MNGVFSLHFAGTCKKMSARTSKWNTLGSSLMIAMIALAGFVVGVGAEPETPASVFVYFEYVGSYGKTGHATGEFLHPHGMAFSPDGSHLAVCDTENNRIVLLRPSAAFGNLPVASFSVAGVFGGIWPFEGSQVPSDPSDKYLEKVFHDDATPLDRDFKGRPYHGGQARIRSPELIPMNRFARPECVTWFDNGTLLVTDTDNHRVKAVRADGETLWVLGAEGWKDGYFHHPMGIAVDEGHQILVTEPRSKYLRGAGMDFLQRQSVQGNRLQIFGPDLKPAKRLGHMHHMSGEFSRQFKDLTRVFMGAGGDIYLTDTGNHRIQVFDKDLQFKKTLQKWPRYELRYPYGIHGNGELMAIADTGHHQVIILDSKVGLRQIVGKFGIGPGEFSLPREACFGPDGSLYVLDTMNSRIQIFSRPSPPISPFGPEMPSLEPDKPASAPVFVPPALPEPTPPADSY